jgi:DNA-binding response OmpR family regulator
LIDDEVRKAQALIDYFQEVCEWSVEVANGPDRALELLDVASECPYNVIVLDVMMDPGETYSHAATNHGRDTGLILFEAIFKLTCGRVFIILYSARTDLDHLKNDGRVAAYIQKPASAREIARAIRDLLSIAAS